MQPICTAARSMPEPQLCTSGSASPHRECWHEKMTSHVLGVGLANFSVLRRAWCAEDAAAEDAAQTQQARSATDTPDTLRQLSACRPVDIPLRVMTITLLVPASLCIVTETSCCCSRCCGWRRSSGAAGSQRHRHGRHPEAAGRGEQAAWWGRTARPPPRAGWHAGLQPTRQVIFCHLPGQKLDYREQVAYAGMPDYVLKLASMLDSNPLGRCCSDS